MTTDVVFTLTVLMDSGLIGFIGVIAGALTTGGVQLIVEHQNRRNDALSAGRLVWGAAMSRESSSGTYKFGRARDRPSPGHRIGPTFTSLPPPSPRFTT